MLSTPSVVIGTNLAEVLTKENITLVAKRSTLLEELSAAINNNKFSNIEQIEDIQPSILSQSTGTYVETKSGKVYSTTTHDSIMDNYIVTLSEIATNYMSFTRDEVNAEVTTLSEHIRNSLYNYNYREPEEFFNVSYFTLHEVFKSDILNELSNGKMNPVRENIWIDSITELDLLAYILTGDEDQDRLISTWFNSLGHPVLLTYLRDDIPEYSLGINKLLDHCLINFLFYRNLTNKVDLKFNMTTVNLRTIASNNRDFYGNRLTSLLEQYRKDIANGVLLTTDSNVNFSYHSNQTFDITVYEESFNKLVEEGGTIEVIFGYISNEKDRNVSVTLLNAERDKYIHKWHTIRSLYMIHMNNSRLEIFKQVAKQCYDTSLLNPTEAEKEIHNSDSNYLDCIRKEGFEYINNLEVTEIDDIDYICLILVAKIRYKFANSYYILSEMRTMLNSNKSMTPMEAALYASCNYIADFLFEQLDVVRV